MKTTRRLWTWTRWAPLLALTAMLAACGGPVTPDPAATPDPAPADRQATCVDSAIHLPGLGPRGIHGAIVSDTLHMGGATAPATCMEPANQSLLAGLPMPDGRTEQAQQAQSRYYLIVINYPSGGNRLYVVSRRPDGTSCVVNTNDQCIAQVTDLPDDFDLQDLPEDVRPTIPAGRPAPPTVDPPPAGPGSPPGGDGAPAPEPGTAPDAAGTPQPSTGATGVAVSGPLLSWAAASRALSYDVYWGTTKELAADTDWSTPINTSSTFVTIAVTASLEHETLYYWRVDAKNEAGTTRGTVWSFTTAAAPAPAATGAPGAAIEKWPPDGATRVDKHRLTLYWDDWAAAPRPGVVSFDVYVGTKKDLTADTLLEWPSSRAWPINVPGFQPIVTLRDEMLRNGTRYYWRVDTKTDAGAIRGDVWSFTTAYGVSNRQPSDGATGVTVDGPLLSWDAAPHAIDYWVRWSHSLKAVTVGTHETINTRTSSTSMRLPALAHETRYYWQVTAVTDNPHIDDDPENGSTTAAVGHDAWSFTTAAAPPSPGGGGYTPPVVSP